jgi:hypothetical protein
MRKNISQWFFGLSAFLAICLTGLLLYPSAIYTDVFYKVCGYTITNAFILIASYAILRKLRSLALWRFIVYLASAVAGNICIDFILPVRQLCPAPFISDYFLMAVFGDFILLAIFNFMLSRLIFLMKTKDAVIFGVMISLINNVFCLGQYCK